MIIAPVMQGADKPKQTTRERLAAAGYQLVLGPSYSVQIILIETKAMGGKVTNLYIYDYVITDNDTEKIRGGRGKNRLEASVGDMHLPGRWQFRDLNGDGLSDFRYYKGDGKKDFWWAEIWDGRHSRFTFAKEFAGER